MPEQMNQFKPQSYRSHKEAHGCFVEFEESPTRHFPPGWVWFLLIVIGYSVIAFAVAP